MRWFDTASETLLRALDTEPSTRAWTFTHPTPSASGSGAAAWRRSSTAGTPNAQLGALRPLDAELAGEGVAEVFDAMTPRQVERGRLQPPRYALQLTATDTGASWTYGPGAPVAALTASAEDLLLLLWGRLPAEGGAFAWDDDQQAGRHILDGPLTA